MRYLLGRGLPAPALLAALWLPGEAASRQASARATIAACSSVLIEPSASACPAAATASAAAAAAVASWSESSSSLSEVGSGG
jgi:hypothetical protein